MSMPASPGTWLSAAQIAGSFAVSPATLELYRLRSSLGCQVDRAGQVLFDAAEVATLFRRRGAPPPPAAVGSLGRLGEVALGR
jgi:hypothetical protein